MSFNVSITAEWFLSSDQAPIDVGAVENTNIVVKIYPQWYKQISLEWEVPPNFGNCVFNVYFSQTEDGPFNKLNATPISGTFFSDTSTQEYSKFDHGWYVVESILLDKGGVTLKSQSITWNTFQTNWVGLRSTEIQRREYLLLSRFVGINSYLFRKKSYGKRCPSCWDPLTEQILNDHCPVCIGTSFEGGFFDPAELYLQYETTPNSRDKTYYGKLESNQIGAWTISMPLVNSEDIIVRSGDWAVYRVEKILPTELQANTVRQIMTLTQVSKGDVEYELIKRKLPGFPDKYTI